MHLKNHGTCPTTTPFLSLQSSEMVLTPTSQTLGLQAKEGCQKGPVIPNLRRYDWNSREKKVAVSPDLPPNH